ncbi:hypothetical protein BKA67DRAFT_661376 [Truncatella angustata]|uniref:SUZ domain-containing protein n=1 Tax=Truncatella angustata TaxID=152316 RepID=A0A9P8ZT61_9PEZI|nr:uncharacterized protein BKA67DRAFT_661376 [Truncatella angustata]KAH6648396.1 hypothetical protein BKA67DRAFT_661376 [Truncatella angustata]KAH8204833.1 hypothetical protein TruAng_001022 [Truncatella angustata]
MVKTIAVPDAWEDDWEAQADRAATEPPAPEPAPAPLSKKERIARHAELNRKIWQAAEEPDNGAPLQYLSQQPAPPLAQQFKAPMTLLSRKPVLAKRNPVTGGMASMTLDDSDDEDKKPQETIEEIRARQQREREERQRRYDEARAKIFGDSGAASGNSKPGSGRNSGTSTPGTTTPPRPGGERRGRGRGRGGHRGGDRNSRPHDRGESGDYQRLKENTHQGGASLQKPSQNIHQGGASLRDEVREKQLYDPDFSSKPGFSFEKRSAPSTPGRSTPRNDEQVIRAPRGPDGSGRGGFGFVKRGARES